MLYKYNVKGIWDKSWYDRSIAIVGAREASTSALDLASQVSQELASNNITIITGIARGIDVAAHKGSFMVEGHLLVAVVVNGVEQIVP